MGSVITSSYFAFVNIDGLPQNIGMKIGIKNYKHSDAHPVRAGQKMHKTRFLTVKKTIFIMARYVNLCNINR